MAAGRDLVCVPRFEVSFSTHAVERFQERRRPALAHADARVELERLAPLGRIAEASPEWHARTAAEIADAYLLLGEDIVLPLVDMGNGHWLAKTCLTRGSVSEAARARRNARRRQLRARRSARRRADRPRQAA